MRAVDTSSLLSDINESYRTLTVDRRPAVGPPGGA